MQRQHAASVLLPVPPQRGLAAQYLSVQPEPPVVLRTMEAVAAINSALGLVRQAGDRLPDCATFSAAVSAFCAAAARHEAEHDVLGLEPAAASALCQALAGVGEAAVGMQLYHLDKEHGASWALLTAACQLLGSAARLARCIPQCSPEHARQLSNGTTLSVHGVQQALEAAAEARRARGPLQKRQMGQVTPDVLHLAGASLLAGQELLALLQHFLPASGIWDKPCADFLRQAAKSEQHLRWLLTVGWVVEVGTRQKRQQGTPTNLFNAFRDVTIALRLPLDVTRPAPQDLARLDVAWHGARWEAVLAFFSQLAGALGLGMICPPFARRMRCWKRPVGPRRACCGASEQRGWCSA
ncbi:hypothetical protein ABPG75_008521 [Micractinium tetrahymenae]